MTTSPHFLPDYAICTPNDSNVFIYSYRFFQSPVTINAQKKDANMTNERQIAADIYAKTMKEFKIFFIQSTISDSVYSNSEELVDTISDSKELVDTASNSKELVDNVSNSKALFDAVSNPSINPKVATYTTNGYSPHGLLENSEIPAIIQGTIPPVLQATVDGVLICGGALNAIFTVLSEEIVTGVATSAAHFFKDPPMVN